MPMSSAAPQWPVLITADRLAAHRDEVVLADVRWYLDGRSGRDEYQRGHLPGAVFVDIDRDLASAPTPEGGRHPLPDPQDFAQAMGALGIAADTPVVAYDDAGGSTAARLVWLLRALGAPASLLDGGLAAWRRFDDRPLATGTVAPAPLERAALPWPERCVAELAEVRAATEAANPLLLDARTHDRYTGTEPAPVDARPGHIPTARSAPWQANLDADGRFLPPARMRERFASLGAEPDRGVIAYCGSGVTACHNLLALEIAGYPAARLYPGSFSAWGEAAELPVRTGEE